jgi:hypothetical protein
MTRLAARLSPLTSGCLLRLNMFTVGYDEKQLTRRAVAPTENSEPLLVSYELSSTL